MRAQESNLPRAGYEPDETPCLPPAMFFLLLYYTKKKNIFSSAITLNYQSANQLGASIDLSGAISKPNVIDSMVATLTTTGDFSIAQKVDRLIVSYLDNQHPCIFAYSDSNSFTPEDTISVSWLISYI